NPIYGMYRREAALKAFPTKKYVIAGQIFLQKMAILGEFAYIDEATFYRREVRSAETSKQRLSRYQSVLYGKKLKVKLSFWQSVFEIISTALKTPINSKRNRTRIRSQLIFSSFTAFVRFWSYLW
ncbi:MAG TPA: hypothetical protein VEA58_09600, partial [Anaerovoracaceae bacterium]|nr:hypothetical protein [Anaerovoracaceae bacterium]